MEYKLLHCESCKNVVSVEDNDKLTFVCPACGLINKRNESSSYHGKLIVTSPDLNCNINKDEKEGVINIADADEDLLSAIMLLIKYGWSIKFKGTRINEDD